MVTPAGYGTGYAAAPALPQLARRLMSSEESIERSETEVGDLDGLAGGAGAELPMGSTLCHVVLHRAGAHAEP
jgi:hypothetical protein